MLALPLQRGTSSDVVTPLTRFLSQHFGGGGSGNGGGSADGAPSSSPYAADVAGFQRVRDDAVAVTNSSGEVGVAHLSYMVYQLSAMAPRLSEYQSELRLAFAWLDAFKPTRKIDSTTLWFELACFLWNLAALHSELGSRVDRSTEAGIKAANKHFQLSAGALEAIGTLCMPQLPSLVGTNTSAGGPISVLAVKMGVQLMLAQAQLCFYEKAVRDRKAGTMKPGIIAKLAAQTAVFYGGAAELCKQGVLASYLDPSWAGHCAFQHKCFQAAAEYWQSQAVKEEAQQRGSGYAEEITRLMRAEGHLKMALELANTAKLGVSLTNGAAALQRTVTAAKTSAEHDNRTVYMERVPADAALTAVSAVSMVKPAPLAEFTTLAAHGDKSPTVFFKDVVPREIVALLAGTKERLGDVLAHSAGAATLATNDARHQLSALGLPGSLETHKTGGQLPENLWVKVQRVQALGGLAELNTRFADVEAAAVRAETSMAQIEESVGREERADEAFRARFPQWGSAAGKGTPSKVLNVDIKANLERLRQAHANARSSDAKLQKELGDAGFVACMDTLALDKDGLTKLLPQPTEPLLDLLDGDGAAGGPGGAAETQALEKKLFEMAGIIEHRDALVQQLRAHVSRDVGESILAAASARAAEGDGAANGLKAACESAVQEEVRAAEALAAQVGATVAQQADVMAQVAVANNAFNAAREGDAVTAERDRVVRDIEQSVSRFLTAHSQLAAAAGFYANLQSRLSALLLSSDDLAYTQGLLRQEHEAGEAREFEKSSQEDRDREYALQLAAEMDELTLRPTPGQHADQPPAAAAAAAPATLLLPGLASVSAGVPVAGPVGANGALPPQYSYAMYPASTPYPGMPQPYPVPPAGPAASPYNTTYIAAPTPMPVASTAQPSPYAYQQPPPRGVYHEPGTMPAPPNFQPPSYPPPYVPPPSHPMPQPQPQPQHAGPALNDGAVARLTEMGFPRDRVVAALASHGNDEEAALNALLV